MGKLTSTIGIPIKLLNESQGHDVTIELTTGVTYRGRLLEETICSRIISLTSFPLPTAEDSMNVQMSGVTVTARDGKVSHLEQIYIRGSNIRYFIIPDMLKNAAMFKTRNQRGRGVGLARGKATVQRARAGRGGPPGRG
ncbi:Small nuclear ribonucleoprotein Sm D3 [Penicillium taxi]|uniref:Small nuclear ribonucleoprotein Sm D3 n=1 Tax=Penicillium taxi TaxID=168475 RepID=UPI00254594E7|nr:Small nuclear ribonucleoprotein Sm D3 [Penicillium taxi]KAJ5899740.1 Small nuclear ribonucleoprotein Sm D3 [Penicillium taxi]